MHTGGTFFAFIFIFRFPFCVCQHITPGRMEQSWKSNSQRNVTFSSYFVSALGVVPESTGAFACMSKLGTPAFSSPHSVLSPCFRLSAPQLPSCCGSSCCNLIGAGGVFRGSLLYFMLFLASPLPSDRAKQANQSPDGKGGRLRVSVARPIGETFGTHCPGTAPVLGELRLQSEGGGSKADLGSGV